ncbi:sensor histidine kinase [Acidocella sp.]|jgi:signal transduction histidine kinase|uniref:sensor histidine kinase n=1 Tax=Acidocella sp. TaxID=50710 RepID=UPI002F3F020B
MTAGTPASREQLERELQYYKTEYNDIGARLLRLQEEQSRVAREARRSKIVARLVRAAYQLVERDIPAEAIGDHLLAAVIDASFCDRAALLTEDQAQKGHFHIEHAAGVESSAILVLSDPPDFLYSAGGQALNHAAAAMTKTIGVPYVLWAYAPETRRALLLGKRSEGNIHRPFEPGDRELLEVALAVYADVLLRRIAETTLQEAKQAAEAASNARARFLANLSHELGTPLNSIIGFSELLLQTGVRAPRDPQRQEFAGQILDAGRRLLSLTRDILDFSSLSNAPPQLRRDWVPVGQLLRNAVRAFGAQTAAQRPELFLQAPAPELQALIDYDRFRQILANLIGNALKFTPTDGQITLFVELTDGNALQITVADTGVGIPADDIKRILEPFVQLENDVHQSAHGAGLGLPIVKQLVEAHGGNLTIESALGRGTIVTIALPAGSGRLLG